MTRTEYMREWKRHNSEKVRMYACRRKAKMRDYAKEYRKRHPDSVRANKQRLYEKRRARLQEIKRESVCVRCGETDACVLDFHHRDPSEKTFSIAKAQHKPDDVFFAEVAKCDVLCANCHRREHCTI